MAIEPALYCAAIIRGTARVARSAGIDIIAGGVETASQLEMPCAPGCAGPRGKKTCQG